MTLTTETPFAKVVSTNPRSAASSQTGSLGQDVRQASSRLPVGAFLSLHPFHQVEDKIFNGITHGLGIGQGTLQRRPLLAAAGSDAALGRSRFMLAKQCANPTDAEQIVPRRLRLGEPFRRGADMRRKVIQWNVVAKCCDAVASPLHDFQHQLPPAVSV